MSSIKRYELKIFHASSFTRPQYTEVFPCKTGGHQKDLDLIETEMTPESIREICERVLQFNSDLSNPIGFNVNSMPAGSALYCKGNFIPGSDTTSQDNANKIKKEVYSSKFRIQTDNHPQIDLL